jgi:hypothetical protein
MNHYATSVHSITDRQQEGFRVGLQRSVAFKPSPGLRSATNQGDSAMPAHLCRTLRRMRRMRSMVISWVKIFRYQAARTACT